MKNLTKTFLSSTIALGLSGVLAGCANQGPNQQVGALAGGIAGGILGGSVFHGHGRVPGAIGGAIIGSMLGSSVGQSMDEQDRMNAEQAMINTPIGREASWSNRNSGANYTVRPVNEYDAGVEHCRRALTTVYLDGRTQKAYTTVCRTGSGPWRVK